MAEKSAVIENAASVGAPAWMRALVERTTQRPAPEWLRELRRTAGLKLYALGVPTLKHEEWKYTDVRAITGRELQPAAYEPGGLTSERIQDLTFDDSGCHRIVLVNGFFSSELSRLDGVPAGVTIDSLGAAMEEGWLADIVGQVAAFDKNPFVALNAAAAEDGAVIRVHRGVVEQPIHIVYVAAGGDTASNPRALIVLAENTQATVVESFVSAGDEATFTNAVTEIVLGENAVLEHSKLEAESLAAFHVATTEVRQARGSAFITCNLSFGGALVRNDINSFLGGEGSTCTLNGLYVAGGRQHVDNHTKIDHAMPHCPSHELYKGILDGQARGVFNGKIHVHPDAQKTDAKQTNQNLLLSRDAEIDTKPQLEIYADDVRCTHGATIGQLSAEQLFYLRARGVGLEDARALLTYAFASDIVGRVKVEPLRDRLEERIFALQGRADEDHEGLRPE